MYTRGRSKQISDLWDERLTIKSTFAKVSGRTLQFTGTSKQITKRHIPL